MVTSEPLGRGQTLLELNVANVELNAFASLFERLAAAGVTFSTLRERQTVDSRWLEQFTFLDNETRSTFADPQVPRTVAVMRARLTELALEPDACFVALEGERWIGYTVLDTARSSTERLHQSWTGVLPAYRQRGIGTALKLLTVRYARQNGYTLIETALRTSNVASQVMNWRVGFRPPASNDR
jgi:GNAT superfamily N-acetyltransferase